MEHYSGEAHVNVGTGTDITIRELAECIAKAAQWQGSFTFDTSKPDGTPRKVMDVSCLTAMGWTAKTAFDKAVEATYQRYLADTKTDQCASAGGN
jgi:GDP-L-fucose synthase